MTFDAIMKELKQGKYKPIYALHGEESYFIDQISDYIEDNALPESEKSFNQTILYGKDTDYLTLMDIVRRYPMMSPYQVVILKEAQQMRDFDKLENYVQNPSTTTIFVICHKYKKIDSRKTLAKKLKEKAVFFYSEPLKDYKVPEWIQSFLSEKGMKIDQKAAVLLEEYLGSDLSKIANSIEKLMLNVPKGESISSAHIEKYIGISKDYNVFELNNALMKKDVLKANKIINYFISNPKATHIMVVVGVLYSLFSKLYMMHSIPRASDDQLASIARVPKFFLGDYKMGLKNYSADKTEHVISLLHEYDIKAKGVNAGNLAEGDLYKELLFKIMH